MVSVTRATRELGIVSELPRSKGTPCSDNAIYDFSKKAVENGLDIFRVFDSLNYIENVRAYGIPLLEFVCSYVPP